MLNFSKYQSRLEEHNISDFYVVAKSEHRRMKILSMKRELGEVAESSLEKLIAEQIESVVAMVEECNWSFPFYIVKDNAVLEELREKEKQVKSQLMRKLIFKKLRKLERKVAKANENHAIARKELEKYKRTLHQELQTLREKKQRLIQKLESEANALAAEKRRLENEREDCTLL